MADPITNAKLEQKRIEAEIEALRGKLNKVASFIEMYEEFAGRPDVTAAAISPPPSRTQVAPGQRRTIPDRVAAILSDGIPRKPHVLLSMLEADGTTIGTGDEGRRITNLSSQLSRDKVRFKSSRAIGWSLRDQPEAQTESPSTVGAGDGLNEL